MQSTIHEPGALHRPCGRPGAAAAVAGVALAALLGGCGGGTRTVVETGPPRTAGISAANAATATSPTAQPAGTQAEAPTRYVSLATFQSPSGNIGCAIAGAIARCDIVQRSWKPPARPASCPRVVDFGQGLEVAAQGPGRLVCAGDTAREPASPRLPYGSATRSGGFTCASRRTGMTCTAADGHGFELSRQGYKVH